MRQEVIGRPETGRDECSFMRGWSQVKLKDASPIKQEILLALGKSSQLSFYNRLYGSVFVTNITILFYYIFRLVNKKKIFQLKSLCNVALRYN